MAIAAPGAGRSLQEILPMSVCPADLVELDRDTESLQQALIWVK